MTPAVLVDKRIIVPRSEKEDKFMNETDYATLWEARAMWFPFIWLPWDAVKQKILAASRLISGEKVAHFENDTPSEK